MALIQYPHNGIPSYSQNMRVYTLIFLEEGLLIKKSVAFEEKHRRRPPGHRRRPFKLKHAYFLGKTKTPEATWPRKKGCKFFR